MKGKKQIDRSQMTVRELMKTPEGEKELDKLLEPFAKSISRASNLSIVAPPVHRERQEKAFLEYYDESFYTLGRLIDFPDPKAIYVLVVKVLWAKADASGFLSYDAINTYLERNGGRQLIDNDTIHQRIANALATLGRKRARQRVQFPMKLPDGSPVVRAAHGKGLILRKG